MVLEEMPKVELGEDVFIGEGESVVAIVGDTEGEGVGEGVANCKNGDHKASSIIPKSVYSLPVPTWFRIIMTGLVQVTVVPALTTPG